MLLITVDTHFLNGGLKMGCELLATPALGLAEAPGLVGLPENTFPSLLYCHPDTIISSLCYNL